MLTIDKPQVQFPYCQIPNSEQVSSYRNMSLQQEYNLPPQEVSFDGFLFDMDGTIIDSTEAVVKHWQT